ncbi:MAG: iron-sulfur cluster assembly accessory protein [Chitinophagia bacterium]|nr:iron-sulfur cluster assembly accessory protein [Chitinophagia bacterium]
MNNEQTSVEAPVRFTPATVAELRRIMSLPDFNPVHRLRIGVKGGGCAGLSYILSFEEPKAGDEETDIEGIPCIIQPAHQLYLHGMEVDWGTGLDARGFVFRNPNASATCGCGSSFAV